MKILQKNDLFLCVQQIDWLDWLMRPDDWFVINRAGMPRLETLKDGYKKVDTLLLSIKLELDALNEAFGNELRKHIEYIFFKNQSREAVRVFYGKTENEVINKSRGKRSDEVFPYTSLIGTTENKKNNWPILNDDGGDD